MKNRRRLLIVNSNKSTPSDLPDGYTKINFLRATGAQYINTDVSFEHFGQDIFNIQMYAGFYSHGQDHHYSGWDYGGIIGGYYSEYDNYYHWDLGMGYSILTAPSKTKIDLTIGIQSSNTLCTINDQDTITRNNSVRGHNTIPYMLFALTTDDVISPTSDFIIYDNCKIIKNDELIRNFIPALDINNRPCMYDTVTERSFYNAGTGEFLYG